MLVAPLARKPHAPPPALTLWDEVTLPLARVHEICGRARRTLALRLAAQAGSPVIWIAPAWGRDPLNPPGMAPLIDPGEVIFAAARRPEDLLWAAEESLRAGVAPVVVAELPEPPPLTPVRRLHLAAEAGAEIGRCRPLGLLLTPGSGGAPGVETRFRMEPAHAGGQDHWRLDRLRARMAPPCAWRVGPGGIEARLEPDLT
ncbi:hypothetical protein ROJ8625_02651 [Roseivivax jejudonensis]|uniref:SOS cell division inhibitor n=1 Tax=Roseivivax jejudonensis TaxID=1529041 RepID=A0A1X6ZIG4_9RHOB|nr:hypothetical protein [Roseivivax jejudonensis]SLN52512.1 hypothetical protein ROJ8625_02651 [Roseivivax jejudonensis]